MSEQDLLALLDELEGYLAESSRIPLTGRILVNEQEIFEIIDRLRQSIPEALHQAQKINRERERLLQQAREEGDALINESRAYAERMLRESVITQKAQEEADRIMEEARRVSREIRLAARDYADELMERVEAHMMKALAVIRQGREELGMGQAAAGAEEPPPTRAEASREREAEPGRGGR
jgi:cell division septum initiation protein DivIVA